MYNDTERFVSTFYRFDFPVFVADMSLNVLLNFIDIYLEAVHAMSDLQKGDYNSLGVYTGKIVADVFLKNPLTKDWTFNNSEVFMNLPPPDEVIEKQLPALKMPNFNIEERARTEMHRLREQASRNVSSRNQAKEELRDVLE